MTILRGGNRTDNPSDKRRRLYQSATMSCNCMSQFNRDKLTMKLRSPVRIVDTDHAGFQVSGWKSLIDRQSLWEPDEITKPWKYSQETALKKYYNNLTKRLTFQIVSYNEYTDPTLLVVR